AIAIDEWMGASPVYTARMQKLLGFEGDDVATIFKGMQFDIGAPHGFLDFRYVVHDRDHGGFQLDHCGALMDVEPMGEDYVFSMCHDIEDPTFDATASATNPRARMRPLHRPPREPSDREPHCAWTVDIEPDAEPIPEAPITAQIAECFLAGIPLPAIATGGPEVPHAPDVGGGPDGQDPSGALWDDYSGDLVDRIATERFSRSALLAIIDEVCFQQHLLAHSFMVAVQNRQGTAAALELGEHQFIGSAGLSAHRLAAAVLAFGSDAQGSFGSASHEPLAVAADVLALHPALHPRGLVVLAVERYGDELRLELHEGPGTSPESQLTWPAFLRDGSDGAIEAIVCAVDPLLRAQRIEAGSRRVATWRVWVADTPAAQQPEVEMARFSTGTDFELRRLEPTPVHITL
ncbi:MAG: hypothetical protein ACK5O2_03435, partial [Microthrixaceae bacterium]